MKFPASLVSATAALSATAVLAGTVKPVKRDVTPVTVRGNAFFAGDTRFYVRGVDYQPGGSSDVADPIADVAGCRRDLEKFRELGINTIRVYTIDNTLEHDECMNALADAGIYLVLDVNTPLYSLNRANPARSYNDVYLQNVFATVDKFAKYDNTLAFFSGNEVINDPGTTGAAPYVKAVTRDIRQYIGTRGLRRIPVGYSAADVSENRKEMADYMNCGTDDERSDFFAFNDYSWCDPSDFKTSGWEQKVQNFSDYSIPLFLSEYGCNKANREWNEVASLFSTDMSSVFSGGLVYEYSEEDNNYGLVVINGDSIEELDDFQALRQAFADQENPSGDGGYKSNGSPSECPPRGPNWDVEDTALPAMPELARRFLNDGAGRGAGLDGDGSQEAGTASSTTATPGSGAVTSTAASATRTSAAGAVRAPDLSLAPIVCAFVVVLSACLGSSAILV